MFDTFSVDGGDVSGDERHEFIPDTVIIPLQLPLVLALVVSDHGFVLL